MRLGPSSASVESPCWGLVLRDPGAGSCPRCSCPAGPGPWEPRDPCHPRARGPALSGGTGMRCSPTFWAGAAASPAHPGRGGWMFDLPQLGQHPDRSPSRPTAPGPWTPATPLTPHPSGPQPSAGYGRRRQEGTGVRILKLSPCRMQSPDGAKAGGGGTRFWERRRPPGQPCSAAGRAGAVGAVRPALPGATPCPRRSSLGGSPPAAAAPPRPDLGAPGLVTDDSAPGAKQGQQRGEPDAMGRPAQGRVWLGLYRAEAGGAWAPHSLAAEGGAHLPAG